jgi:predicted metal-dependent HD superfamily phosphohydrolase
MNPPGDHDLIARAIWFHDAVYDPKRQDNEERSALLAEEFLSTDAAAVARLVRVTKNHSLAITREEMSLCDIDLSILGMNRQRYQQYAHGIRQEYGFASDMAYWTARLEVLRTFNSGQIYKTKHFYPIETQAHANLQWEMKEIEIQLDSYKKIM